VEWRKSEVELSLAIFFGPIATPAWAAYFPNSWQSKLPALRSLIQIHALIALCIMLAACAEFNLTTIGIGYRAPGVGFIAGTIFIADISLLALVPSRKASPNQLQLYKDSFAVIIGGTAIAIFCWSFVNIGLVGWQAQSLSTGSPYCIQVAAGPHGGYKEITSLFDLGGLKMRTPYTRGGMDEYQFAFHAVLVIAEPDHTKLMNWTYWRQTFVPISNADSLHVSVACKPRPNFAREIPVW
jgi:multisubunit Na+/H+ antiporter MnhB subunit